MSAPTIGPQEILSAKAWQGLSKQEIFERLTVDIPGPRFTFEEMRQAILQRGNR